MLKPTAVPPITFLDKKTQLTHALHLSFFNKHISTLVSDLMSKLYMINTIRHLLDQPTLLLVINSLVSPNFFIAHLSGTSKFRCSNIVWQIKV